MPVENKDDETVETFHIVNAGLALTARGFYSSFEKSIFGAEDTV